MSLKRVCVFLLMRLDEVGLNEAYCVGQFGPRNHKPQGVYHVTCRPAFVEGIHVVGDVPCQMQICMLFEGIHVVGGYPMSDADLHFLKGTPSPLPENPVQANPAHFQL